MDYLYRFMKRHLFSVMVLLCFLALATGMIIGNFLPVYLPNHQLDNQINKYINLSVSEPAPETIEYTVDISVFPTASDACDEMLELYRAEVSERIGMIDSKECFSFVTDAEIELINFSTSGNFDVMPDGYWNNLMFLGSGVNASCGMWYPVVYKDINDNVFVYYTTDNGTLQRIPLLSDDSAVHETAYSVSEQIGIVHTEAETDNIVKENQFFAAVYDDESHALSIWTNGTLICEHNLFEMLPELSEDVKFVGHSSRIGYLFLDGTNIYTIPDLGTSAPYGTDPAPHVMNLVASNVNCVLDTNFIGSSSFDWHIPVFQLTTGEIVTCSQFNEVYTFTPCEVYDTMLFFDY